MAECKGGERKVLICVDGSEHCDYAFNWYADNIRKETDTVICLHVTQIQPPQFPHPLASEEFKRLLEKESEKIKLLEDDYKEKCKKRNMHGKIKVVNGDPLERILKEAETENVSLIVVGTRGQGLVRRTVLGSISSGVVHNAHVPTVVAARKD